MSVHVCVCACVHTCIQPAFRAVRPDDVANTGTQVAEVKQHRAQLIPGWVTDCATVRSKAGRLVAIQTWGGVQSCL